MSKIYTYVYKSPLGDSTANGLTSKVTGVELYHGEDLDLSNVPDDSLVLVERELWGEPSNYAVPASILKGHKHSMFGGNFIYTSDSRFPEKRPIPVHDRVEL